MPTTWLNLTNGRVDTEIRPLSTDGPGLTTTNLLAATPGIDPTTQGAFGTPATPMTSVVKFEAGLRVCPRCKKPIHLGATRCRECGNPVPRA